MSAIAGLAFAEAPVSVPRPPLRAGSSAETLPPLGETRPVAREELAELVREAGLEGKVSIAVVEVGTGNVEAGFDEGLELPPASVAKALTALYALEFLPPGHRFATRLLATGPVRGGRIEGDLILAGGGDPILVTDRLAELAQALARAGVREVGGFRVWGGALPRFREITPEQLPWVGYNPSIGGLNLNFNRVHFEWARSGGDYRVRMEALGDSHRPDVSVARMRVVDRSLPVYSYEQDGDTDRWTVARGQLGDAGSRWLPVRAPDLYTGEAFVGLANEAGVVLPAPTRIEALPEGLTEIARLESDPLEDILRDMLLHSTNPTAEIVGVAASVARGIVPGSIAESAQAMNDWLQEETGARFALVDHSGLGGESRVTAEEMVRVLAHAGVMERLWPILKNIPLTDAGGNALRDPPGVVRAKTGTLNFATSLAGYARTLKGTDLAFAYFSADVEARRRAADSQDEIPAGSREFLRRSRRLQQRLLQRWGLLSV
jgi:D-alanyl-D-alanine carboxypeptidase/D-alanyl-D-alanine-endopeptidase (penicillin-binding protein 4)